MLRALSALNHLRQAASAELVRRAADTCKLRSAASIRTNLSERRRNKATPMTARTGMIQQQLIINSLMASRRVLSSVSLHSARSKVRCFWKCTGTSAASPLSSFPSRSGSPGAMTGASLIYQSGISISRRPPCRRCLDLPLGNSVSPFPAWNGHLSLSYDFPSHITS